MLGSTLGSGFTCLSQFTLEVLHLFQNIYLKNQQNKTPNVLTIKALLKIARDINADTHKHSKNPVLLQLSMRFLMKN